MSTRTGLLAIVAVAALAACSNGAPTASESVPSAEHSYAHSEGDHDHSDTPSAAAEQVTGPVKVVTALYPMEWLAKEIGGDHVAVTNLVAPGQDAHGVELSPSSVQAVTDADVVLRVAGLAPAVDDAAAQSTGTDVNVAPLVELKEGDHSHDHGKDDHDHDDHGNDDHDDHGKDDHNHDHGKDDHDHGKDDHGQDHDDHDHGGVDPHFWLDPERMADLAPKVADAFVAKDAANAKVYTENAAKVAKVLRDKDAEWEGRLKGCAVKTFVPTHMAFGYFADAYDLKQLGIKGIDPDSEPSPEHLQEVRDAIKAAGVTTVFAEPADTKALAEGIAQDVQVEVATLDPLESLSPESPGKTYLEVMQANIDAIAKANRC